MSKLDNDQQSAIEQLCNMTTNQQEEVIAHFLHREGLNPVPFMQHVGTIYARLEEEDDK